MTTSELDPATSSAARERRHVYIDSDVVTVEEPAPDRRHDGRRVVAPGAADAVALLSEGHDVLLVAPTPIAIAEFASMATTASVPDSFPSGSWYVTADGAWCEGERPNGLRSILVGPRRPPNRRPTRRCDIEARDLNAAVMEILVRETMA
jgi:hypothetical protein